MNQFSKGEIANWISIYLAAAMCCAIATAMSVSVTVHGLYRDKVWEDVRSVRVAVLLPKAWWRWQKLYLLSTPVTLGIVSYYAATMTWS